MKMKTLFAGAIAAASLAIAPAAFAHDDHDHDHVINIGDGDLLEHLIDLDAEGIEHMRADIAEAREEIEEAILEIEEAKEEVKSVPGGRVIVKIAFGVARRATSEAVGEVLTELRDEIDDAEIELAAMDISDDERIETQGAIDALRADLDDLELALNDLVEALRL